MIPRIPVHDEDEDGAGTTPLWRRPRFLLVVGVVAVIVIFALSHGQEPKKHAVSGQKTEETFIGEVAAYQPPARLVSPAQAEERSDMSNPPQQGPPAPPPVTTQPVTQLPPPAAAPERPVLPQAPSFRSMVGQQPVPPAHSRMLVYAVPPIAPTPAAPPDAPETGLDFKTSAIPGLKASAAIDDTYQLMPGLLPMVLDTAINSDVPGPLLAHLPGPVYSPKGVLLMEAGTQVIGKYQSMGKGSRLMAGGLYAHTPHSIWVPLTAQGMADDLGRSGLPGNIDNHYLERFGFATLLTLTDQVLQVLQAEASKGGSSYINLNGGGGGVSSLASQILQSQINMPPTFTKNAGETIALFLDQPIDFSASYRVHTFKD